MLSSLFSSCSSERPYILRAPTRQPASELVSPHIFCSQPGPFDIVANGAARSNFPAPAAGDHDRQPLFGTSPHSPIWSIVPVRLVGLLWSVAEDGKKANGKNKPTRPRAGSPPRSAENKLPRSLRLVLTLSNMSSCHLLQARHLTAPPPLELPAQPPPPRQRDPPARLIEFGGHSQKICNRQ